MKGLNTFFNVLLIFTIHCLILHGVKTTTINDGSVSKNNELDQLAKVRWIFNNESILKRSKRSVKQEKLSRNNEQEKNHNLFDDPSCRGDLRRLCNNIDSHNDDMQLLECIQSLKVRLYLFTFIICITLLKLLNVSRKF